MPGWNQKAPPEQLFISVLMPVRLVYMPGENVTTRFALQVGSVVFSVDPKVCAVPGKVDMSTVGAYPGSLVPVPVHDGVGVTVPVPVQVSAVTGLYAEGVAV